MNDKLVERDALMERVRAASALVNGCASDRTQDELALEAFMAIFHPERATNRQYMNELKATARKRR
jgi:hypothetical protein